MLGGKVSTATIEQKITERMRELVELQKYERPEYGPEYFKNLERLEAMFWSYAERNGLLSEGLIFAGRRFLFRLASWIAVDIAKTQNNGFIDDTVYQEALTATCEWFEGMRIALEDQINWNPQGILDHVFERAVALRSDIDHFHTQIIGVVASDDARIDHDPFGPTESGLKWWLLFADGNDVMAVECMRPSGCGTWGC
jgi:hypothetical protein